MEKSILEQKLLHAKKTFPLGMKVCNLKLGSVGRVVNEPAIDISLHKILIDVAYDFGVCIEDVDQMIAVQHVQKCAREDSYQWHA